MANLSGNEKEQKKTHLIIVAGGSSQRFGGPIPKQYTNIHGKTILRHTLDNALRWKDISSIRVVIHPDHKTLYNNAIDGLSLPPPILGGKERKDSVYNALREIDSVKDEDIILVHDAARPFTKEHAVQNLLSAMKKHQAATLATPITDTLRKSDTQEKAGNIIDRTSLWSVQTPQAFRYKDILYAHEQTSTDSSYTDDTSLVSNIGIHVKLVKSSRSNIKITTKEDIHMAEALLPQSPLLDIRTGTGFDVHAFDKENKPVRSLTLCGVNIEHEWSLCGHSDADVALHALTDALLGAIGENDIGHHFPPSDDTFKDMDSLVFLKKATEMLKAKNGHIQNADITIICETPKIEPYRNKMKEAVSKALDISVDRVNIKATTTEKLGYTGRKEGIAAQAIVTVYLDQK